MSSPKSVDCDDNAPSAPLRVWGRYWFAPEAPLNLGLCRAAFFGVMFWFYCGRDYSAWAAVDDSLRATLPLFRVIGTSQTVANLAIMQLVWKVALLLACFGLLTRPAAILSALLGAFVLGQAHNYGKTHHFDAVLVLTMFVLAASRGGDAFSVDALVLRWRGRAAPQPSGDYRWPVRAVWMILSIAFFAAGLSKLRNGGLNWMSADSTSLTLLQAQQHVANADPPTRWGVFIAQFPMICSFIGIGSVLIEVGYPLAMFSKRARWIFVPSAILMQTGIWLLLGPTFLQFMFCNVFWIPWDKLWARCFATSFATANPHPESAATASSSTRSALRASPGSRKLPATGFRTPGANEASV